MQRILARADASADNVQGELEYTVRVGGLTALDETRPTPSARSRDRQRLRALLAESAAAG